MVAYCIPVTHRLYTVSVEINAQYYSCERAIMYQFEACIHWNRWIFGALKYYCSSAGIISSTIRYSREESWFHIFVLYMYTYHVRITIVQFCISATIESWFPYLFTACIHNWLIHVRITIEDYSTVCMLRTVDVQLTISLLCMYHYVIIIVYWLYRSSDWKQCYENEAAIIEDQEQKVNDIVVSIIM